MKSKLCTLFLLFFISAYADSNIKVIHSGPDFLQVEFTPVYSDTSILWINNEPYIKINISDGFIANLSQAGLPGILKTSFNTAVPSEFGNNIQVIAAEYKDIMGKLAPVPRMTIKKNIIYNIYEVSESYDQTINRELISFGEYGLARDMQLQAIDIYPVQFFPDQNRIRTYTKIVFRINFPQPKNTSASTDNFLSEAVVNYKSAKNWKITQPVSLKKGKINSVLSSGKWFRFECPTEGIYKIGKDIISNLGINTSSIDPKKIKIYNNGGKVLPENINILRPQDLQENSIFISGEEDGKFDDGDYILFYGRGIHFWDYDTLQKRITRYYHSYSSKNYYWITFEGTDGKRMQQNQSSSENPSYVQTTTLAYTSWEEDKSRVAEMASGRLYLGDELNSSIKSKTYTNKLDGLVSGSPIKYKFRMVSRSERSVPITIVEQSTNIYQGLLPGVGIGGLDGLGNRAVQLSDSGKFEGTLTDDRSELHFRYQPTVANSTAYIDFFEIYYNKYLKPFNDELLFFSDITNGIIEYKLSGFPSSDIRVFNISDYSNVKIISNASISGGDCIFRISEHSKSKYFAVSNSAFKAPSAFTSVENSNIHGIAEEAKFIIISPKEFIEQANRLKNYRENEARNKMKTVVIDINHIYNEFSGGSVDVSAIRDFIKYCYDNWTLKPEYVLLFGDGDYDYKNIYGKNQNFIIPYESVESFHYINSYTSDDWYTYVSGNDSYPDIALGRINALSQEDASIAVDKIIHYESGSSKGLWRNLITLISDDEFGDDKIYEGSLHTAQSENISTLKIPKSFDQQKIYLTTFPSVLISTGLRKPTVNKAIVKAMNEGTLLVNWVGHGNPKVWAHEYVYEQGTTIPQLISDKYFFLTAATCDFGRYDEPGIQSSTEDMLLKPDGGTIGTFTASRAVYSSSNAAINEEFYKNLFTRDSLSNLRSVGRAYYLTKLKRFDFTNDLKFHLFGDPSLKLNIPEGTGEIDSINHAAFDSSITVKALSSITITGSIKKSDGSVDNTFNGEAILSVFDSERRIALKQMNNFSMEVPGGVIYKGTVSVTNGIFSTEFIVPKDISYENRNGKVVAYIYNSESDGIAYTKNIIIGGTDSSRINDGKGPEIEISFDNGSSENSYLVNPDFTLHVKLIDNTGLNTTGSGIGHKLEGILNGNENEPIDFTNYFVGDKDAGGKSGEVKYNFTELETGDYNILVKAWDVFNNFSSDEKRFTVVNGDGLVMRDVVNYPNPFSGNTTFTFQHNLPEVVNVKIKIFTVAGRMIMELESNNIGDKFVRIDWDGRDNDGNNLANGTYLYKVIVKTTDDRHKQEVLGKLAIIR